jgi:lipoprotein-anchoring transpeptidase ErfK/SrfK
MMRRWVENIAFVAAGTAAATAVLAFTTQRAHPARPLHATRAAAPVPARRNRHVPFTIPRGASVVAHARFRRLPVYTWQRGRLREVLTNPTPGGPLVLLVRWTRPRWTWPAWVRVYLNQRPNGSIGWIRARDVTFLLDRFRVTVDLTRHALEVDRGGKPFLRTAIGVGRSVTPTPTGTYFIAELLRQPDPNGLYGPYAFGTSAYSNVLTSFGGGPGEIGIHGTDYPQGIGTDVSHGCIRLLNRDIVRLAHTLPLGTPVEIVR